MVEVLISLVIVTFGLIGVAGLHLAALKNVVSSKQRSLAAQYASDLADRMRANPEAAIYGDYFSTRSGSFQTIKKANPDGNMPSSGRSDVTAPVGNCQTGCTSSDVAKRDLADWYAGLSNDVYSNVTFVVCRDSGETDHPDGIYRYSGGNFQLVPKCDGRGPLIAIKIHWLDDKSRNLPPDSRRREDLLRPYTGKYVLRFDPSAS